MIISNLLTFDVEKTRNDGKIKLVLEIVGNENDICANFQLNKK
jgi:hypothetical protein